MSIKPIRLLGDPILWIDCEPVDDTASERTLINDLRDTLLDFRQRKGFGRGIAAPQIGIAKRVIYVDMAGVFEGVMFNPIVISESPERFELWDDCFSFPDLMVRVSRATSITVQYLDHAGQVALQSAEGALSELLQHEIDHTKGILAIQRAVSPRAFMMRQQWEKSERSTGITII